MKNLLFFSFLSLWVLVGCQSEKSIPIGPEPGPKPLVWLSTSGNRIVDDSGRPVILRGVNRSGLEYLKDGNGITEAEIQFIVSHWRARILRIPFNQEWIMNDPDYVAFLDRVIGWINRAGAYALIDLHWENTVIRIPPIPDVSAMLMWESLAARYRDNPGVLFDIHNEAHDTHWEAWRNRAILIIEAIRRVHPRSLIFVCGLDWAYDLRGWERDPLPYENIVYATHPYPFKREPWAWEKYFGAFAERYPVFAGEFGGGPGDLVWGRRLLRYLREKGIGWTAWSWVDAPHLTQADRRTPTEFGRLVRLVLQREAGVDTAALSISGLEVREIGKDRATLTWKTSTLADAKVWYGKTESETDSLAVQEEALAHRITLTGLSPGTRYVYRVGSQDWYGDRVKSSVGTFETLP